MSTAAQGLQREPETLTSVQWGPWPDSVSTILTCRAEDGLGSYSYRVVSKLLLFLWHLGLHQNMQKQRLKEINQNL